MYKLLRLLTFCLVGFIFTLFVILFVAFEEEPLVDRQVVLAPEHVERAKKIINVHRYQVRPGMTAVARVRSEDVDLAANYLADRFVKGSARVALAEHNAHVLLSIPISWNPMGDYLNIEADLVETKGIPQPQSVHIGSLVIPDLLTNILMPKVIYWLKQIPKYRIGLDALREVKISQNELNVVYHWEGGFAKKIRASIVSEQERKQLFLYHSLLTKNSFQYGTETTISLSEILPPLLNLAAKRSETGNALEENRAAILVVTFYTLGSSLKPITPDAATWPKPVKKVVTVSGRDDFAKHFMVSATIAAYADTALSDVVGLYKEIEDSRTGSGFSFNDIAADRAGTRFGEKAVASEDLAKELQKRVGSGLIDSDLMPHWSDLPEFMPEVEFKRRFGGVGAPAYKRMMQKIDRRVSILGVLN